ncbi:hypothetical protein LTSEHVI_0843 [Salmonella enterica subsp. enterica serovar Hvittingfoss str. A4-620]|nr:hypothetical protein LTSEHVI_0843 [Salmonella enterica subsp. enterica serovar Hvittingfoss str. A4-620]
MPSGGNRYPDIACQLRQHAHNAKLGHPQSERTQRQRKNNFLLKKVWWTAKITFFIPPAENKGACCALWL